MSDYENKKPVAISFALDGPFGLRGFVLPAAVDGTLRAFQKSKVKADQNQAEMTAWRNIRDWVLAQMALVESCDVPLDEVFFPYLANKSGMTVYQLYAGGQLMIGCGDE